MRKILICLIILSLLCMQNSYAGPAKKLGRGLANTFTGWLEIPFSIRENSQKHGYIAGGLYGIPIGVVKTAIRTLVGVYEVVTFALPFPEDFEHIVEPEFVWEPVGETAFEPMRAEELE